MNDNTANDYPRLNLQETMLYNEIIHEDLSYPKSPMQGLDFSFHVMFLVLEFFNCI